MELVMYVRDKRFRDIVDEKVVKVYKKDTEGKDTTKVDKKEYWVRLGRARPIGLLVSNSKGSVGWSLVHDPDQFNRVEAFRIARDREKKSEYEVIPNKIRKLRQIMIDKSNKAFSS
jgi:hypothetical protein